MKEKIKKVLNILNKFIQSDYFIALIGVMTFIGWYFNIWVEMLFVMLSISVLPLFFFKETKHLIPFLMMFTCTINRDRHDLISYRYLLIPFIVLLVIAFVFSLVRFKRDWSVLSPKKIKGFHLALILLIIPFALGGVGSPTDNALAIVLIALLILIIAFGYTFFVVTNTGTERKQIMDYAIKVLYVMGVVIVFQILSYYINLGSFEAFKNCVSGKELTLGWGSANNAAPVLSMSIPATLYLCVKKNKVTWLFTWISLIEILLIFLSGCRGAILFTTLTLPFMFCYIVRVTENKWQFCTSFCVAGVILVFVIGFKSKDIFEMITNMANLGLSDNHRYPLYHEAIRYFKKWPAFGAGWDYLLGHKVQGLPNQYTPRWYHCTVLQIMANMGVCGLIFFAIFYYWRYRSFAPIIKKPQGLALLTSLLLFEGYGMVDVVYFGPTFFIMLAIISFAAQCGLEDYECLAFKAKPYQWIRSFVKKHEKAIEPADE